MSQFSNWLENRNLKLYSEMFADDKSAEMAKKHTEMAKESDNLHNLIQTLSNLIPEIAKINDTTPIEPYVANNAYLPQMDMHKDRSQSMQWATDTLTDLINIIKTAKKGQANPKAAEVAKDVQMLLFYISSFAGGIISRNRDRFETIHGSDQMRHYDAMLRNRNDV